MKSRLLGAICACAITSLPLVTYGAGTWETTLLGRDLDGNPTTAEAYYDVTLNTTWLADGNFAHTSGYDADGFMSWADADTWATGLDPYGSGIMGWRLPNTNPIDGTTADDDNLTYNGIEDRLYNVSAPGTLHAGSTASEMAHLFYNTLGNISYCDPVLSTNSSCSPEPPGWGLSNTGPFNNLLGTDYWSSTVYVPGPNDAWVFNFGHGYQDGYDKSNNVFHAWAVHSGDVGAAVIPIPPALWLFASGLIGLVGVARRKAA